MKKKSIWRDDRNLSLLVDFYEYTMSNGLFVSGHQDTIAVYDYFYRRPVFGNGFSIVAGVEQFVCFVENLTFSMEDIKALRGTGKFSEDFLRYLMNFRFTGDIWSLPEGSVAFPQTPIVTIKAPAIQAKLVSTMLMLTYNHQSLIATKTYRIVKAAEGRPVLELGTRRAHGPDAAMYGARAAIIGGASGSACTQLLKIDGNVIGTMGHDWIQFFDDEYTAFKTYAQIYPDSCLLLVDTYNTLKSGVPNAIRVAKEILMPLGKRLLGIRIDSGDLAYLSKKARKMLNEAGLNDCLITVSNSLDEDVIRDLISQEAPVDVFGVGEKLITAKMEPVFNGVEKIVAVQNSEGIIEPRIKLSDNIEKMTTPCFKELWRLYDRETGKAIADVMTLWDEVIDDTRPYEIFDQENTWKRKTLTDFTAKRIRIKLFENGRRVCESPSLEEVRTFCTREIETLWDEVTRLYNPHKYYVDLSQPLWDIKFSLIRSHQVG
jgi:nicotinate phosphoribosyltransferase